MTRWSWSYGRVYIHSFLSIHVKCRYLQIHSSLHWRPNHLNSSVDFPFLLQLLLFLPVNTILVDFFKFLFVVQNECPSGSLHLHSSKSSFQSEGNSIHFPTRDILLSKWTFWLDYTLLLHRRQEERERETNSSFPHQTFFFRQIKSLK